MAIRQRASGVIRKLGAVGAPVNKRIVSRAKLPRGVHEVKNPRQAWRLK